MKIVVQGVGHTKFGATEQSVGQLMKEAALQALEDAGVGIHDIDTAYVANLSSSFGNQCHLPAVLASELGLRKGVTRVESACASGGVAIKEAVQAIVSGMYNTVLVVGVEKMMSTPIEHTTKILASAAGGDEIQHGATFPSLYGLMAQRHFHTYGTTQQHLAKISVKNHKNAMANPLAQFHKPITEEDVFNSRVIADPIKLLDCSPISDGAAAVILTRGEEGVALYGLGHSTCPISLAERADLTIMPAVVEAGREAYAKSGISPSEIDFAEVHDCFTIAELIQTEDLGFCEKGQGGMMIETGQTALGGRIPINPSGGLKAKGHPIGATGVSQVVEIVKQLRGQAGERQVENARVGLACNIGGSGATAVVSIWRKEA